MYLIIGLSHCLTFNDDFSSGLAWLRWHAKITHHCPVIDCHYLCKSCFEIPNKLCLLAITVVGLKLYHLLFLKVVDESESLSEVRVEVVLDQLSLSNQLKVLSTAFLEINVNYGIGL